MSSTLSSTSPFQLLEINIIAAQDLAPVSKQIKAYAVAWLRPERKLATQIDQAGHTNPTWNEKFVFRVDEELLNSVIMIEIYVSAWLRDVLIGTVGVLVSNLLPPCARSGNRKPKLRFVALQIRRPSGRPQGILNIGVALVDSTMRSMPIYSDISSSAVGFSDLTDSVKKEKQNQEENNNNHRADYSKFMTLQRCQSEKNDSTINDYSYHGSGGKHGGGYGMESEFGVRRGGGVNDESLCSDVGPSPSVVAAAIAKGLYQVPQTAESSAVDVWSESNCTEGMKTKMERWRTELTPAYEVYDAEEEEMRKKLKQTPKRAGKTPGRAKQGRGGRLFSCFGTAFGCEFSVTCGGGGRKKKRGRGGSGGKAHLTSGSSEVTYDESSI